MNRLILLLILPFLLAATSRAWWLDYAYEPKSNAEKYGDHLSAIDLYSCKNDQYFSREKCQEIKSNGGKFSVIRDLNNDGVKERWSVGVAKYKSGEYSYANVVVLSDPETQKILEILEVKKDKPGFAILFGNDNELSLYFCMFCGHSVDIKWKNNNWVLDWPEPYG